MGKAEAALFCDGAAGLQAGAAGGGALGLGGGSELALIRLRLRESSCPECAELPSGVYIGTCSGVLGTGIVLIGTGLVERLRERVLLRAGVEGTVVEVAPGPAGGTSGGPPGTS